MNKSDRGREATAAGAQHVFPGCPQQEVSGQLLCGDAVLAVAAVDFMRGERRGAAVQRGGKTLTWWRRRWR